MKRVKEYLKSSDFGVKLLIGSVVVQGFHSYFVFADLSNFSIIPKIFSSVFYAIILSSAILYYTMINKKKVAFRFQIFESIINLYYFFQNIVEMFVSDQISLSQVCVKSIMAIGIAIMMPYVIFEYAGSISEDINSKEKEEITNYVKEKIKKEAKKSLLSEVKNMKDVKLLKEKYE